MSMPSPAKRTANLTSFQPGQSGNPLGRKPGSRNRVNDKLLAGLEYAFDQRGNAGVLEWANKDPGAFYKTCASLTPAKFETSVTTTNIFAELNLTDPKDFAAAWDLAKKVLHGEAPLEIEANPINEVTDDE
jgi:hypothetical protein